MALLSVIISLVLNPDRHQSHFDVLETCSLANLTVYSGSRLAIHRFATFHKGFWYLAKVSFDFSLGDFLDR